MSSPGRSIESGGLRESDNSKWEKLHWPEIYACTVTPSYTGKLSVEARYADLLLDPILIVSSHVLVPMILSPAVDARVLICRRSRTEKKEKSPSKAYAPWLSRSSLGARGTRRLHPCREPSSSSCKRKFSKKKKSNNFLDTAFLHHDPISGKGKSTGANLSFD